MSIFVSVASYCEPHLQFTLDQLFGKAAYPEAIHVGLIDQSWDANGAWLRHKPYASRVRHLQVDPVQSRGVSWARALAMSLYEGEDFYLQIDSHMRFEPEWDRRLIEVWERASKVFPQPIISAYPPAFEFDEAGRDFLPHPHQRAVYGFVLADKAQLSEDSPVLGFKTRFAEGDHDLLAGIHLAGGFLFTEGGFVEDVPYDPYMYFEGEEQNLTLRAFTRGWTPVHPRGDWIPLQHLYKQAGSDHRSHHWHPEIDAHRAVKWPMRRAAAAARLLRLVRGELRGVFGLGNVRSLEEYCRWSRIDYLRYRRGRAA